MGFAHQYHAHALEQETTHRLLLPPPASLELVSIQDMKDSLYLAACPGEEGDEDPVNDTLLAAYITVAREWWEEQKNRAFVAQTWLQQSSYGWRQLRVWPCPVQQVTAMTLVDHHGAETVLDLADFQFDLLQQPAIITPKHEGGWWVSGFWPHGGHIRIEYIAGDLMPVTADATANTLTALPNRSYTLNERVVLSNRGGSLPAPLQGDRWYYVINPSGASVQLSLTASGSAIDLTDAGTGVHFFGIIPKVDRQAIMLLTQHMFENRLPVTPNQHFELPFTLTSLLWHKRVLL